MLAGWLLTGTVHGALTGLVWGGLVRIFALHHVTWSVNSLCHLTGSRPFKTRRSDRATNLWPLAIVSFGDSWHNLHHADPTSARHGVDPGQIDLAAGFIKTLRATRMGQQCFLARRRAPRRATASLTRPSKRTATRQSK